jgi:hypothetical protein
MDARTNTPVPLAGLPLRELSRLAAIARVAAAKGWQRYVERLGLGRFSGGEAGEAPPTKK